MDPKAFKEICDQFERKRQEEIFALQSEMLIESVYTKKGGIAAHVRAYSKKVIDIFFR
ncbi:hypothetical protein LEP1GSC047_0250 [Leptospira inadai serovar Lyme str. 10]|uniref:Uncharacterized protein n=1 Tax=Leptospira inadai serovar Lyme str. 10 TaxID=1049790 RepID=V6H9P1_9LEPT|nr:hypothetical protein LEP1GSC047_0250 [Leptospira inadai serovar Lyme str. 10]